jgi:hypothetical protein
MKAPMLLMLASLSIAQAAEPTGRLTLACSGTTSGIKQDDEPISMGIIVDFADRTVHGFGYPCFPGCFDFPVKITAMNEVTVAFHGSSQTGVMSITGSIDRVTGDVRRQR